MTAAFNVLGGLFLSCGSLIHSVITMPGSINKAVIKNTLLQGKWSAKISDKEPGIKLAIL